MEAAAEACGKQGNPVPLELLMSSILLAYIAEGMPYIDEAMLFDPFY